MGDGPVEQDHLASDVVDEVLARDLVAGGAHEANQGIAEERDAAPADMQRTGGVRTRVLEQDPLLPGARRPVPLPVGTYGGERQLRHASRAHREIGGGAPAP